MEEYLIKEINLVSGELDEAVFNFTQDKLNFAYSQVADLAMVFDGWSISKIIPKGVDQYIAIYKRSTKGRDHLVKAT